MTNALAASRRFARLLAALPEACRNCLRFRVFFLLPRWFRMPATLRVGNRRIALRFPREEGIDADFITCLLRNTYGLGRDLGAVETIVDVGANVGFFSLAARSFYPGATIHAYEPNLRIQGFLTSNTEMLQIQVLPEALGAAAGYVTMIDRGPSDQAQTRASAAADGDIRQVSLETAIARIGGRLDLLKLDCEGAEWEILRPGECWKSVRNIRLEYHLADGETARKATDAIAAIGFRVIHLRESGKEGGILWALPAERQTVR